MYLDIRIATGIREKQEKNLRVLLDQVKVQGLQTWSLFLCRLHLPGPTCATLTLDEKSSLLDSARPSFNLNPYVSVNHKMSQSGQSMSLKSWKIEGEQGHGSQVAIGVEECILATYGIHVLTTRRQGLSRLPINIAEAATEWHLE
jgi:hypothetical protein